VGATVLAVLAAGCTSATRPAASTTTALGGPHGMAPPILVGHSGRWLTNAEGQVVLVHGLNMVYKRAPYEPSAARFGSAAASTLAADGFDVVRVGVIYAAVEPRPGVFSASYVDSIASTVSLLAREGVYSLLDFHQDQLSTGFGGEGFPAWSVETNGLPPRRYVFPLGYTDSAALDAAFDNFWADRAGPGGVGLQQRYAAAWQYVARRFAGNPWVLGYDVFNEPWPAHASSAQLGAFYGRVISEIRSVDRQHLIFYEPFVLFDFGVPTDLPSFGDPDLGMSFHDYCLEDAAAHEASCLQSEQKVFENALARSTTTSDALLLSEFGATDDLTDLAHLVDAADSHEIPWIEWAYCGCDDPTGSIPPAIEALVSDPGLPGKGDNVDAAKLAVLAEPYPRVVAGTPTSYSFDRATHTFQLTYLTRSPSGHAFAAGSCTAVVLPAFQFPTGYVATVQGARVTSAPDAGVLTLAQTRSTGGVTVRVRPAAKGQTAPPTSAAISDCR
jgi:endoglycosylceramidase